MRQAFTAIQVGRISTPGFHRDTLSVGLYLQVATSGTTGRISRSWVYRFNSPLTGKLRWLGLGSVDVLPMADARKLAQDYRRMVRVERRDPVEERRKAKMEALKARASAMTFAQACDAFLAKHGDTFKNAKHRAQWRSTLDRARDAFGKLHVAQIETAHIVNLLTPIWAETPETGSRLRARIERVLDYAAAAGIREGPNPARWQQHLEHLLSARKASKSHSAMPWRDLPGFMAELRGRDSLSARALEFAILTAARTGEVIGAKWSEIDLAHKVWTIPAERMKAKIEHKVPLCDRALEVLSSITRKGDFIFASGKADRPLSNMAMLKLLRVTAGNGYTVHGFRSAFRDWAGENTNFPRDICEFALAHKLPDKVEAAYRRETAVGKRVKLMQSWATYCAMTPSSGAIVTPLKNYAGSLA